MTNSFFLTDQHTLAWTIEMGRGVYTSHIYPPTRARNNRGRWSDRLETDGNCSSKKWPRVQNLLQNCSKNAGERTLQPLGPSSSQRFPRRYDSKKSLSCDFRSFSRLLCDLRVSFGFRTFLEGVFFSLPFY